jgi:dipeptidyl aminopeptidase/acylaminoacyl peptidase
MPRRPITAEDLLAFKFVSDPQMSPDGDRVAYAVKSIDGRKYHSHLWVGDRPFTSGAVSDAMPRWAPDGRRLAFARAIEDNAQIHLIAADGGESRALTRLPAGKIKALEWSPDGSRLAFVFHPGAKEKEAPVLRHVTRLRYKEEGAGFLDEERDHVWVVWVRDGKTLQVTKGEWDDAMPAWSPDSAFLAFASNRHPDADYRIQEIDLWIVPAGGGQARKLPKPRGPAAWPRWSPDGKTIAYLGHDKPEEVWGTANLHVWSVPASGRGDARDLIDGFDRTCEDLVITDTKSFHGVTQPPVWSADGRTIHVLASDHGTCHIYAVPASGGAPKPVTHGAFEVMGFSVGAGRVAMAVSDPLILGEIYTLDRGSRRRVSALNDDLWSQLQLSEPEDFDVRSVDGTTIQGWLLKPASFTPSRKWPVILQVHGGPRAQYGYAFFHEFQLLAAQGYVVLYTNPRGSQGYGEAFARAIVNDWGSVDYKDLMAAVDAVCRRKWVDEKRLGVCGGSYGGYMTNWIIGHTDRFRAAITMRCVSNLFSFYGTSDFGFEDHREFGGHAFDVPDNYARQSPISFVKNITTPLLITHGEQDLRCPIEQAEQIYTMLKAMKRDVEMVRFPEETHDLSRSGRPDRRVARLKHILRWWKRHLA